MPPSWEQSVHGVLVVLNFLWHFYCLCMLIKDLSAK